MSSLDAIIEDLKALPPERLEIAANYIRHLRPVSREERDAILSRTSGALSPEEADEMDRVIEEGCERIDESGW